MSAKLVLYDFDGTITKMDTFPEFFKYSFGKSKFLTGFFFFSPLFVLYKLNLIDGGDLKKYILNYFLKGKSKIWIDELGEKFITYLKLNFIIKEDFLTDIETFKHEGATIAVVSASPDIWVEKFCLQHNIDCICTELEYIENIFSGNFKSNNCNGPEKKKRVLEKFDLTKYSDVIVYGDSQGDKFMMELATVKKWVK